MFSSFSFILKHRTNSVIAVREVSSVEFLYTFLTLVSSTGQILGAWNVIISLQSVSNSVKKFGDFFCFEYCDKVFISKNVSERITRLSHRLKLIIQFNSEKSQNYDHCNFRRKTYVMVRLITSLILKNKFSVTHRLSLISSKILPNSVLFHNEWSFVLHT